ncbi:autotransporter domain-containing protein [Achromobacter spanius]|uniref:autotransporter domain-containing protein n=1 Tax=Achromobacter spanius TaxID=217203 RepID=UPI0032092E4D
MPSHRSARHDSALPNGALLALRPLAAALAALFACASAPAQASSAAGASSFDAGAAGAGSFWSGEGMNGQGGFSPAHGGSWAYQSINAGLLTGGTTLTGGLGGAGDAGSASYVAGGGAGGGTGAMFINTNGVSTVSRGTVVGGRGGNGGASISGSDTAAKGAGSGGGGGGGDGMGLDSSTNFTFTSHGVVVGGLGGSGGTSSVDGGVAGGGGDGGNGIYALSASGVTINNLGSITGGIGGNSIAGFASASGALAGAGGAGVVLGSAILNNEATGVIVGGNSGAAGSQAGFTTMNGAGGTGVSVTDGVLTNEGIIRGGDGQSGGAGVVIAGSGTLINAGTIQGGTLGGSSRADAVLMSGTNARLELRDGYSFQGGVRSTGTGNVLALGGAATGSFDMTQLGVGFIGFSNLEKTGSGTWQLTGLSAERPNWAVKSGTLNFVDGAQLGDSASTIALGAARLAYTPVGGLATVNAAISLTAGSGTIDVNDRSVLDVTQGVHGLATTLIKEGLGTLRLNGPSDYGRLLAANGRVILNHDALPQLIASAADVSILTRGDLTYGGGLYGLNGQFGTMTKDGPGTLTLTDENYLGWRVEAGGLAASAQRFQGNVDMAAGSSFVLDEAVDSRYRDKLSGMGTFAKRGAAALELTGDSTAFTGSAFVQQGTLNLASGAVLGGSVSVSNGATLGGSGKVASLEVRPGGTLSLAGGDFKVTGNATFQPDSIFAVRADPNGTPGRLVVDGAAILQGGNLLHVGVGDGFALNSKYTIVSASYVQGQFSSVNSQYAYLTAKLDYTDKAVNLELVRRDVTPPVVIPPVVNPPIVIAPPTDGETPGSRPIRFEDLAETPNQHAVGVALESLPQSNPLYGAVLTLPAGGPPQALTLLSGESHASTASALAGLGANARAIPLAQLRRGLGATLQPGAATASAGMSDAPLSASALPGSDALPAWAQVVGQWQRSGGEDGIARVRQHTGGVYAGADRAIGNGWRLGGAVGVTNSKLKADGLSSQSDIDSYSATVYGGRRFDAGPGHVNLLLGAAYTWHDISSKRSVAFAGVNEDLKADYGGSTGQLFGEIGYGLPVGERAVLEPYVGVAFSDQRVRGFSESGGDAALSGNRQHDQTTTTTLGLRGMTQWDALALTAGAGWRHAFGDVNPMSTLAFTGSDAFTVAGAPIARNALVTELAGQWRASRNVAFTLAYDGEYGGGNQQHAGTLRVNWRF